MTGLVQWKVLAVDDDPVILENIERVLSTRMGDNSFVFTTANSFDDGIKLIKENRFDLLFLDVHEDHGDPNPDDDPEAEDQRGEKLLSILKEERFVPVIFYTGFPSKVKHLISPVVKVVDKASDIKEVRECVGLILETKLPQLSRYIEEKSRAYIWDSLEVALVKEEVSPHPSDLALLTARNLAQNLSQQVIKQLLNMDAGEINPLETYQYPPKYDSCNPADIYRYKDNGSLWMVLTPACDFEQGKAENVLLAKVTPIKEHYLYATWIEQANIFSELNKKDKEAKTNQKPQQDAMKDVKKLVKGYIGQRYKFLPGTFFLPDCVIDFQDLMSHPIEIADDYEAVCSLDNPYREEILQLFSRYYGRIGTPDYDLDPIWERIHDEFKTN